MKAKFGAIVVDGRGKLGGHVFSKNRAGAYMRTKVTPVNPDTAAQAEARSMLTNYSQAWRALTDAQRAAWNAAVPDFSKTNVFGDIKNPTGFNLFVRLNVNIDIGGGAQIDVPPLVTEVAALASLSFTAAETGQTMSVTFAPTPVPAGTYYKVFATPGMSPGKNFVKSEYRMIAQPEGAEVSPFNIAALYIAKFGALVAGQKIFMKWVPVNQATGQEGIALSTSAIVGA